MSITKAKNGITITSNTKGHYIFVGRYNGSMFEYLNGKVREVEYDEENAEIKAVTKFEDSNEEFKERNIVIIPYKDFLRKINSDEKELTYSVKNQNALAVKTGAELFILQKDLELNEKILEAKRLMLQNKLEREMRRYKKMVGKISDVLSAMNHLVVGEQMYNDIVAGKGLIKIKEGARGKGKILVYQKIRYVDKEMSPIIEDFHFRNMDDFNEWLLEKTPFDDNMYNYEYIFPERCIIVFQPTKRTNYECSWYETAFREIYDKQSFVYVRDGENLSVFVVEDYKIKYRLFPFTDEKGYLKKLAEKGLYESNSAKEQEKWGIFWYHVNERIVNGIGDSGFFGKVDEKDIEYVENADNEIQLTDKTNVYIDLSLRNTKELKIGDVVLCKPRNFAPDYDFPRRGYQMLSVKDIIDDSIEVMIYSSVYTNRRRVQVNIKYYGFFNVSAYSRKNFLELQKKVFSTNKQSMNFAHFEYQLWKVWKKEYDKENEMIKEKGLTKKEDIEKFLEELHVWRNKTKKRRLLIWK